MTRLSRNNSDTLDTTLVFDRKQRGSGDVKLILRVVAGDIPLRVFDVPSSARLMVGREPTCDIHLDDVSVSRKHVVLIRGDGDSLAVLDNGSTNGTRVNGVRVGTGGALQVGDMLDVGNVSLRLERLRAEEVDNLQRASEALAGLSRDPLTGALTRAWLEESAAGFLAEQQEAIREWCVLFFDIDHFKAVNDTCGHKTGDDVIRAVAHIALHSVRARDACVRYGGDEFVLFLGSCPAEGAVRTAERIRSRVETVPWAERGVVGLSVTVSIGVAVGRPDDTWATVADRADKALYAAKKGGRNRIELIP